MKNSFDAFQGTTRYITSEPLRHAVNVALALERPLLVRGEPGTGKTLLAEQVAGALGLELIRWHVKSTTKAQDGLYVYDAVQRLHDSRFGDHDVKDVKRYIKLGPLGRKPGLFICQRRLASGKARLTGLRRCNPFLLLLDGPAAFFDLRIHIALDRVEHEHVEVFGVQRDDLAHDILSEPGGAADIKLNRARLLRLRFLNVFIH